MSIRLHLFLFFAFFWIAILWGSVPVYCQESPPPDSRFQQGSDTAIVDTGKVPNPEKYEETPSIQTLSLEERQLLSTPLKESDYQTGWIDVSGFTREEQGKLLAETITKLAEQPRNAEGAGSNWQQVQLQNARWQMTRDSLNRQWLNQKAALEKSGRACKEPNDHTDIR